MYICSDRGDNKESIDGMITKSTSLLRLPPSVTQMEKENDTPQGIKRIGRLIVFSCGRDTVFSNNSFLVFAGSCIEAQRRRIVDITSMQRAEWLYLHRRSSP